MAEEGLPIGVMCQPRGEHTEGIAHYPFGWAADNGCFSDATFRKDVWWKWLQQQDRESCLFAVAPDVVGNANLTRRRAKLWLPRIRRLGFNAAYVAQDYSERISPPWGTFQCLFIGGSTEWKLSPHTIPLIRKARGMGLWVHMGRVNSLKRLRYAQEIGCHSADGTYLKYGPTKNAIQMRRWFASLDEYYDCHL